MLMLQPASTVQSDSTIKSPTHRDVLLDTVVRVLCKHAEPCRYRPWSSSYYNSSSSGVIISGKRVLTNAHSVEHYTRVKLKKGGSQKEYPATVLVVGTECDCGKFVVPRISLLIMRKSLEIKEGVPRKCAQRFVRNLRMCCYEFAFPSIKGKIGERLYFSTGLMFS